MRLSDGSFAVDGLVKFQSNNSLRAWGKRGRIIGGEPKLFC